MNSCFFIGHREANESLLPRLELEIDQLIRSENVHYFYVGGYGGFDQIAATAVKKAKKQHPDITLMLVLPYHPAERPIEKPPGYDGTYYLEGLEKTPRPFAIVKANQLMVNTCDWLVFMFLTEPAIPKIHWSMPSAGRRRDLFKSQILPRGWVHIYEKEITVGYWNCYPNCTDRSGCFALH